MFEYGYSKVADCIQQVGFMLPLPISLLLLVHHQLSLNRGHNIHLSTQLLREMGGPHIINLASDV